MKEDFESAVTVFEELQAHVPFHFVGKHAGNAVTLAAEVHYTPSPFQSHAQAAGDISGRISDFSVRIWGDGRKFPIWEL